MLLIILRPAAWLLIVLWPALLLARRRPARWLAVWRPAATVCDVSVSGVAVLPGITGRVGVSGLRVATAAIPAGPVILVVAGRTVAGAAVVGSIPAIAGVAVVASVPVVAGVPLVRSGPAVASGPAVGSVAVAASVPAIAGIPAVTALLVVPCIQVRSRPYPGRLVVRRS